jgi:hypothetical protein
MTYMRVGFKIIFGIVAILILVVGGAYLFLTPVTVVTEYEEGLNGDNTQTTKLAAWTACTTDDQCVYALNAHPKLKCVSENCPPEENPQPAQGDSAYEWIPAYDPACVNAENLNNQNGEGEELLLDTRAAKCACQPILTSEGTSLAGQSICAIVESDSLETE